MLTALRSACSFSSTVNKLAYHFSYLTFWVLLMVLGYTYSLGQSFDSQHSVARKWNEVLLDGIRGDFARPTIHARNLFHISMAMYDIWAIYDEQAEPFLMGKTIRFYDAQLDEMSSYQAFDPNLTSQSAVEMAVSYAAYRLIYHRFQYSPGADNTLSAADALMIELGYDPAFEGIAYENGNPAALGNYVASSIINFGMQDGANEDDFYENLYYTYYNTPMVPTTPGNPNIQDPNRWQPLALSVFIDQSGNRIYGNPPFLSPEWGFVEPFALVKAERQLLNRDEGLYYVYHDPGPPPYLAYGDNENGFLPAEYQWGFSLVSIWSAHLDPADSVMWDISPASIGNIASFPASYEEYRDFYQTSEGGDIGQGHALNPSTGLPYEPQLVPRGDYTRVLAEFWADGPDSETPPGHWFSILNSVNDHPLLERKLEGEGEEIDPLEWDIKAYLALGGAMHDAAITAWGLKGWYDYIRPISAIRYMADRGQSSDPNLPNYHEHGLPLVEGKIELVTEGDTLQGLSGEHIGKIKLFSWKGPDYIDNPETDMAGVGWILAENWWPYQRPSFVTPPFAGFVSGHSTFSRAAAEVLTALTGDPFFPGGMGEFHVKKNEFLVFEEGPSVDMMLQWATYRDASDQTSLSRIWGGIHPPADDIPGRIIGEQIGLQAFDQAKQLFEGSSLTTSIDNGVNTHSNLSLFPNPISSGESIQLELTKPLINVKIDVFDIQGKLVKRKSFSKNVRNDSFKLSMSELTAGLYTVSIRANGFHESMRLSILD